MATLIHRVRHNFGYQLSQITPDSSIVKRGFELVDRLRREGDGNNPGHARDFTVRWLGSDSDLTPTDMAMREAWHIFETRMSYPESIGDEDDLQDVILRDRHQVAERLRDSQYFVGYSYKDAVSASAEIGLLNRIRTEDQLDDTGPVWAVHTSYRCLIREDV